MAYILYTDNCTDILSAPDFVSALEDEHYVYFFFREQAVEYINCGKVKNRYQTLELPVDTSQREESGVNFPALWLSRSKVTVKVYRYN